MQKAMERRTNPTILVLCVDGADMRDLRQVCSYPAESVSETSRMGDGEHVVNKKADIVRVYLPPDANTLLSVVDHCLRSRNYVNVIIAGKQPALQYLDIDAATKHYTAGIGMWDWASNDQDCEPDVVMACAG